MRPYIPAYLGMYPNLVGRDGTLHTLVMMDATFHAKRAKSKEIQFHAYYSDQTHRTRLDLLKYYLGRVHDRVHDNLMTSRTLKTKDKNY